MCSLAVAVDPGRVCASSVARCALSKQGHRLLSSLDPNDPSTNDRLIRKFVASSSKTLALTTLSHLLSTTNLSSFAIPVTTLSALYSSSHAYIRINAFFTSVIIFALLICRCTEESAKLHGSNGTLKLLLMLLRCSTRAGNLLKQKCYFQTPFQTYAPIKTLLSFTVI